MVNLPEEHTSVEFIVFLLKNSGCPCKSDLFENASIACARSFYFKCFLYKVAFQIFLVVIFYF